MNIEELSCKIECQDVLAALCAALDEGRNDDAADLFTDDAVLVLPIGEKKGPEVRAALNARPATITTRHLMTNVAVDVKSADGAFATAYILVYRTTVDPGAPGPHPLPETPQAAGDWNIDLRKTPDGWRICRYAAIEKMVAA